MAKRTAPSSAARPPAPTSPDDQTLLDFYRKMVLVRHFEDESQRQFRRGKIGGYLHVYNGQEAVATGFLAALRADDVYLTAYRDHAHALVRGTPPQAVMAELFGKVTGLAGGKGGSMHLFDVARGFYGGYGIVGSHVPLATGMAYALRYTGTDRVCMCFFGDGAMNTGAFHEAANLAGLWGHAGMCPLVYVLENNKYGMGTSVERASAHPDLAARFAAYRIAAEKVDGMDVVACYEAARRAVARARETASPVAVEAITYRFVPHGAADLFQPYRSKDEIEEWRRRDPIAHLAALLRERGVLDDEAIARIVREAAEAVAAAVRFADESPVPPPEALEADVYAGGDADA